MIFLPRNPCSMLGASKLLHGSWVGHISNMHVRTGPQALNPASQRLGSKYIISRTFTTGTYQATYDYAQLWLSGTDTELVSVILSSAVHNLWGKRAANSGQPFFKDGTLSWYGVQGKGKSNNTGGRLHCLYPTAYCLDISRALSKGTVRLSHHIITALRELTLSKQQATVFRPRTTLFQHPCCISCIYSRSIDRITRPRTPSRPTTTPLNLVHST
jgi:hypothetical protein